VQATEGSKPALIVVAYVQLLKDEEGDERMRERNVSAAARGLKDVAGQLGVSVPALVQLDRTRATRADKRRQLADLRESGDLENTADSVLGLGREEMDNPHTDDKGLGELSVLKKRQLGEEVGTMRRLAWVGESRPRACGEPTVRAGAVGNDTATAANDVASYRRTGLLTDAGCARRSVAW
jgi:replicative DNA helicase